MSFACVLFHQKSKARELCEELMWTAIEKGELLIHKDVMKTTLLGYVVKRLEKEGLVTVHRRKGEKTVRVTPSETLKRELAKVCAMLR